MQIGFLEDLENARAGRVCSTARIMITEPEFQRMLLLQVALCFSLHVSVYTRLCTGRNMPGMIYAI